MDEQSTPTELPDDLAALSDDALQEALESARTEGAEIAQTPPADLSEEQVTRIEALASFVQNVGNEQSARAQAAQDRADRAEAAAAALGGGDGEDGDGDESGEEGDGEEAPVETPAPEAAAPEVPAAVAAGATRVPAPAARTPQTPKAATVTSNMTIVASADTGVQAGTSLTNMSEVTKAFIARSKPFQSLRPTKGMHQQHSVVSIERNLAASGDGLHTDNIGKAFDSFQSLLAAASNESRLPGGSLIEAKRAIAASGLKALNAAGWCAPSETVYGLTNDATADGIIDLPTVGINRGGLNFTLGPNFADVYTDAGFFQTEAQAIAGETKNCVLVDCPDFDEVRLDAVGICVKAGLLTRAAYPEVIEDWLTKTIVANQHKVAARLIASMRTALGTALAPTLTGTPITWGLLGIIEWHIEMERQAYRLSESESLEVKIPRWLRVAIRQDLANRMGIGKESVSNADIAQHFADRGADVQFILNYLEVADPLTSVAFPATVEIMVYPAGTFVKGTADVISLDTVYDSADLQTNVYTAAFVEDGVLLAKMKHGGKRITLPVNVTGMLGAASLNDNLFTAQA